MERVGGRYSMEGPGRGREARGCVGGCLCQGGGGWGGEHVAGEWLVVQLMGMGFIILLFGCCEG